MKNENSPHACAAQASPTLPVSQHCMLQRTQLVYLTVFAGFGALYSFLPVYFHDVKGLTLSQVGVLGVLRPAMLFVASPLLNFLADVSGQHRLMMASCLVLSVLARSCLLLASSFSAVAGVWLTSEFLGSPVAPLIDSTVISTLPDRSLWGRQRLWGAAGFGLAVLVVGVTETYVASFWPMFALHGALMALGLHLAWGMDFSRCHQAQGPRASVWTVLRVVVRDAETIIFFVVVLVSGYATGVIETFLFIYLEQGLGASRTLLGLSRFMTCAAEVPLFFVSGSIIRRLGIPATLAVVFVCYILRFTCYILLSNPWYVLFVEPLHGFTFAIMWTASTTYASMLAPPNMAASMQGLLAGTHFGIGQASGALLGGFIYQAHGSVACFESADVAVAGALALLVCGHLVLRRVRPGHAGAGLLKPADTDSIELESDGEDAGGGGMSSQASKWLQGREYHSIATDDPAASKPTDADVDALLAADSVS
eukprot:m.61657 g.61657  ORF g.61657 m.61657 type:complete len:481 (+) comp16210_c0_seq1:20-1462(+)